MVYARFEDVPWHDWEPTDRATLCFVVTGGRVLLIRKKRGLGAGKINGPGGRLDPGETSQEAAVREVQEELGVHPIDLRPAGAIAFQFTDGYGLHVSIFKAGGVMGEPRETDEAIPIWAEIDALPYDEMWADDRIWLPRLLMDQPFFGRMLFRGDELLGYVLEGTPNALPASVRPGF